MATIHELKTQRSYFRLVQNGIKKFEVRKNDRNFKPGDFLILKEFHEGALTGEQLPPMQIQYVFKGGRYGLNADHCIINW